MNEEFWKQFPPIPGFDCVAMKHKAQLRIYEETKGMTTHQLVEYFQRKAETRDVHAGRPAQPAPDALAVKEEPPKDRGK